MLFFLRSLHRRALSHKQVPRLKHAATGQGGIVQRTAWVLESLLCCIQTNSTFSSPCAHASSLTGSSLSAVFFIELAQLAALTWHFDAWRWLQKHRVLMKIDRPWLHNRTPSPWACLAVGLTGKTYIFHRSSLWQPTVWTYIRAGPRTGSRTSASEQAGKLSSIQKDVQWRTPRKRICTLMTVNDLLWAFYFWNCALRSDSLRCSEIVHIAQAIECEIDLRSECQHGEMHHQQISIQCVPSVLHPWRGEVAAFPCISFPCVSNIEFCNMLHT